METMAYPCSPVTSFTNQYEESSSYFLWSPQLASHHEINASIGDAYGGDPWPADADDQRRDNEFFTMMMVQDADGLLCQDDELSSGDHPLASGCCEEDGLMGQEELVVMEESSLGDLLMAGAMAVEAGDLIHGSAVVAKVDDILGSIAYGDAVGSLLDHLAGYFARGLWSRIAGARTECHQTTAPLPANRLPAYQMLQELSPFVKFAHFTANQAILEASMEDPGVHVVDFNVGDGVQWSSLMSDLASRHGSKPFHLTAVNTGVRSGAAGSTPRWLSEFAESLGLPFRFDSLDAHGAEDLRELTKSSANGGCGCSSAIISCDATSMSHSYSSMDTSQTMALLVSSIEILQPKLVILVEDELFRIGRQPPPRLAGDAPFSEFFSDALHHFAAMQESLASCFHGGGYEACLRLVEEEILCPTIEGSVAATMTGGAGTGAGAAVTGFWDSGFRACRVSGFNIAQAKMLAGLFSREFGVVHEEGRLALCWKNRPLTSLSVWTLEQYVW